MKRFLSLLIVFALVAASIGCAAPKQREIDAIKEFFASTGTELGSIDYNSASKTIEVVVPVEGLNDILTYCLNSDEVAVESWNSIKEVMPLAENEILKHLNELGYSASISLSFADPLSPDVPLLTSKDGKIVYEATEAPSVTAPASSSDADGPLSNDPDGAISVLQEFLPQMESDYETYAVQYNETTGMIEIINVVDGIAFSLALEHAQTEVEEGSNEQISLKEGLVYNWNMFDSILKDSGYSVPISLSISDKKQPELPLMTISNGEVVYESASIGMDPCGAVAALEECLKGSQDENTAYTVKYNETAGQIEILLTCTWLFNSMDNAMYGRSADWDSLREAAINSWNTFDSYIRARGYNIPILLSYCDIQFPDIPLLVVQEGEIVYDQVHDGDVVYDADE